MTNVSLPKDGDRNYNQAYKQLVAIIADLKLNNSEAFVSGLLTRSEQAMLVKRLACILMFEQGSAAYAAAVEVGVSVSTAQRLHAQYSSGEFSGLLSCIPKKQKNEFLDLLKDFALSAGSISARNRFLNRLN